MSARAQAFLWIGQRASAAVLALCVLVHLCTIVYAVRGGLSAAELLARTQGNVAWLAFYTVFATGIPLCILLVATRSIETHRKLTDKTSWVLKNRRKIASWVLIVAGIALVGDGLIAWLVVNA